MHYLSLDYEAGKEKRTILFNLKKIHDELFALARAMNKLSDWFARVFLHITLYK